MVMLMLENLVSRLRRGGPSGHPSGGGGKGGGAPLGMLQLGSETFRVVRLNAMSYGIVRLLDDAFLGAFSCEPELQLYPADGTAVDSLRAIARFAVQSGRTRWVPRQR